MRDQKNGGRERPGAGRVPARSPARGDKPRNDKPRGDEPRSDRPRGDTQRNDKPRGSGNARVAGNGVPRARSVAGRAVQVVDDVAPASSSVREVKLHGVNACRAYFNHRSDRIIRAYFNEAVGRRYFAAQMKWLAAQRLAYHLVTDDELQRITGSSHHEGVCLLVRAEVPRSAQEWLREQKPGGAAQCVLALENVGNPHNLGAILRVAAHFGAPAVLVPDAKSLAGGAAVRTAEGGAEFVEVLDAPDFVGMLRAFRAAGWRVLTTSSHKGEDLFRSKLPARCLILFGEESAGLSPDLLAAGDVCVRIPGSGNVESLNVSVAAGILVGEWWRQHVPR